MTFTVFCSCGNHRCTVQSSRMKTFQHKNRSQLAQLKQLLISLPVPVHIGDEQIIHKEFSEQNTEQTQLLHQTDEGAV